jgi:excisionase family DNA binding protein
MTERSRFGGTLQSVAEHEQIAEQIAWMSTQEAARRLGVTTRTLYRFVDEGLLPAYKMGRVFRLQQSDVDQFIEASRVQPGTLEHLYPERKATRSQASGT